MQRKTRLVLVIGALGVVAAILFVVGLLQQGRGAAPDAPQEGFIHIYLDGRFVANVAPGDVAALPSASFEDLEQGKEQEGPWLSELVLLYVDQRKLRADSTVTVSGARPSSGEAKTATLTWAEVSDQANHVLLDIAGSGNSVKLVSTLPQLDIRDEWVQAVQRIEITTKP